MAFVFLSYERNDSDTAQVVAQSLETAGHNVWWDRHIKGGAQFSKEIEHALGLADAVVVLWSVNSVDSAWVRDEAATGRDSGRLVPARIDATSPPLGFRQYQTIDLTGRNIDPGSAGVVAILDTIAAMASTQKPSTDAIARTAENTPASRARRLTRRMMVVGGVVGVLGAGGVGILLSERSSKGEIPAPSPEAAVLMGQANDSLSQSTREGQNQAIGLYRRVVAIAPAYADGWGALALAYAQTAPYRRTSEGEALRARAAQAAERAIALDPGNPAGSAALALIAPRFGGWLKAERALRAAAAASPNSAALLTSIAATLAGVGRADDALVFYERAARLASNPTPSLYFNRITALWASGRLEETDRVMTEAASVFPTHFAIWFARCYILIFSGRAAEAIALSESVDSRPTGVPAEQFQSIIRVARAIESREPVAVESVVRELMNRARSGAGHAENSLQFASALGRLDEAFAIANAYYFDRGFKVPEIRFGLEQGTYTPRRERVTAFLFFPSTARMRADPRFERLTEETGLVRYWAQSGTTPDYRKRA